MKISTKLRHPRWYLMLPCPPNFDDHCDLAKKDFRGVRLVEFYGTSGSGKSTAIAFLCREHRDFCQRTHLIVAPGVTDIDAMDRDILVVVEEVRRVRDLRCVAALLRHGATVLVASHVRPMWSTPLGWAWSRRTFVMDGDWRKIARHLDRKGVPYTPAAVRWYCRQFGANYVDADLIMERCPEETFDASLARFERFCQLKLVPSEK